jgi:hypothetical protein
VVTVRGLGLNIVLHEELPIYPYLACQLSEV